MAKQYFGTDGIRGRVGASNITPDFVMRLGYAAGKVLASSDRRLPAGTKPAVLIGKDPRISGYMLESALEAGLTAAGVNAFLTGPMPTPAIAYLTRALRLQAGIVISASHNPYYDNGIKFFSSAGEKLDDEVEFAIEAELDKPMQVVESEELGKAKRIEDAGARYIEFCKSTFPNDMNLRGLKIVLDCANGATYKVAPLVFHELGADVTAIGDKPNGLNINLDVGSTHPEALQKAVVEQQADLGIAFDGDGDRVMMVDHEGNLLDGDELLHIIALGLYAKGQLKGGVAGTLMTNLALEHAFQKHQIPFGRANVGDRYVLEMLKQNNWMLGGENSGHILTLDKHTSGDAIISALQVLKALVESGKTLKDMGADLTLYPQVLINVTTKQKVDLAHADIQAAVKAAEDKLKDQGRVLLRASGTEPKIRVMVEGQDQTLVQAQAEAIAKVVDSLAG